MNRRREQVLPVKPAKTLMRLAPAVHGAGNSNAMNAVVRHSGDAMLTQKFDGQLSRSPAAGVESIEFSGLCVPVNKKKIAADSIHHGLSYTQNGICGNRGIHGRASLGQSLRARLRR